MLSILVLLCAGYALFALHAVKISFGCTEAVSARVTGYRKFEDSDGPDTYGIEFAYAYGGRDYTGVEQHFGGLRPYFVQEEQLQQAYPVGTVITRYVNPHKPDFTHRVYRGGALFR